MKPAKTFISYAREDQKLCDALLTWLRPLAETQLLSVWHDGALIGGDPFASEIERRINESDLVLLLVTEHFLQSEYCMRVEWPLALARFDAKKARVIPIIARECEWRREEFKAHQVLPRDLSIEHQSDAWWREVVEGIRHAVGVDSLESFLVREERVILAHARARLQSRQHLLNRRQDLEDLLVDPTVLSGMDIGDAASVEASAAKEAQRSQGDLLSYPMNAATVARVSSRWSQIFDSWSGRRWRATVLGDPGFGKTTLLWRAACAINERALAVIHKRRVDPAGIAVYCPAARLAAALTQWTSPGDPVRFLFEYITGPREFDDVPPVSPAALDWIRTALASGRILVLVDALDEVPQELKPRFLEWLEALPRAGKIHKGSEVSVSFVFAVRTASYHGEPLPDHVIDPAHFYELSGFDETQMERAVRLWFSERPDVANALWEHISLTPGFAAIRHSLRSPLLLRMACETFEDEPDQIAGWSRRTDLFEAYLARRWRDLPRRTGVTHAGAVMFPRLLADIAYRLFESDPSRTSWEYAEGSLLRDVVYQALDRVPELRVRGADCLEDLCEVGVLSRGGEGTPYAFTHRSLGEFAAAVGWAARLRDDPDAWSKADPVFSERSHRPAVQFLAGQLAEADEARRLLQRLRDRSRDGLFRPLLALALDCASELRPKVAMALTPDVDAIRDEVRRVIADAAQFGGGDAWRVHVDIRRALANPLMLPDLVNSIGQKGPLGEYTALSAASELGPMAAKQTVLDRLRAVLDTATDGKWDLKRGQTLEALKNIGAIGGTQEIVDVILRRLQMLEAALPYSRAEVAAAGEPPRNGPLLLTASEAYACIDALGSIAAGHQRVRVQEALQRYIADPEHALAKVASEALDEMGLPSMTVANAPPWVEALDSEDPARQVTAIEKLEGLRECVTPEIRAAVERKLSSAAPDVRRKAAFALALFDRHDGSPAAHRRLETELFESEDEDRREAAAWGLYKLKAAPQVSDVTLARFLDAQEHTEGEARRAAIRLFGWLGPAVASPLVVTALVRHAADGSDSLTRADAIWSLYHLGSADPDTLRVVQEALAGDEKRVTDFAAMAIGRLGRVSASETVIRRLVDLLLAEDGSVRASAAYALSRLQRAGLVIAAGEDGFTWKAAKMAQAKREMAAFFARNPQIAKMAKEAGEKRVANAQHEDPAQGTRVAD